MPPEIIDLTSDDEIDEPPKENVKTNDLPGSETTSVPRGNSTQPTEMKETENEAHSAQTNCINIDKDVNRSQQLDNPFSSGLIGRPNNTVSNGKGKERAPQIPEIDLSQADSDNDDDGDASASHPTEQYNEAEALNRAIALSLQDHLLGSEGRSTQLAAGVGGSGTSDKKGETKARGTSQKDTDQESDVYNIADVPTNWFAGTSSGLPSTDDGKSRMSNEQPTSQILHDPVQIAPAGTAYTFDEAITFSNTSKVVASAPVWKKTTDSSAAPPSRISFSEPGVSSAVTSISGLKPPTPTADSNSTTPMFSLASLDRKQMEQERLNRVALKRKRDVGQQEGEGDEDRGNKVQRIDSGSTLSGPPRNKASMAGSKAAQKLSLHTSTSKGPSATATDMHSSSSSSSSSAWATPNRYPDGAVLKTFIAGHPAHQTIDFATLIAPAARLESCVLSSFIWDFDWLVPHFDTRRTKMLFVMHAKNQQERDSIKADFQGLANVRLCFPPMARGCMHSKLMLLFYANEEGAPGSQHGGGRARCRIVVPTANLTGLDWGVGDFMENTVWLIDLPARDTPGLPPRIDAAAGEEETQFQKTLKTFLRAQTLPEDVFHKLDQFDFSKTARIGFVHSLAGVHSGQASRTTGQCGLGRTIADLGLGSRGSPIQMDYVASSLGNLTEKFMSSLYLAAQGHDGPSDHPKRPVAWKENFRAFYPSDSTVRSSKGGAPKAGTICFDTKWWHSLGFPKSTVRDCISVRQGLLMHNKVCIECYFHPLHSRTSQVVLPRRKLTRLSDSSCLFDM